MHKPGNPSNALKMYQSKSALKHEFNKNIPSKKATHYTTRMDLFTQTPKKTVYSVSQLNQQVRSLLETSFMSIWLSGEISNFSRPSSGHWYFSLKDQKAQVRCAMFRGQNQRIAYTPKNGDHVLIRAKISVYEPRGEYQLIASHIEPEGEGNLQQAFDDLKNKLKDQGLFDSQHKKNITHLSQSGQFTIGVITSSTGAAVQDVLSVMKRRSPRTNVIIYPSTVQGEQAPQQLISAIHKANQRQECDALLIVRGGGSIEDLWAFNNEGLAHAIFDSKLPIISGVGHETDFTICDFVADARAPTPSVAGEMATPEQKYIELKCTQLHNQLNATLSRYLRNFEQRLDSIESRLQSQHPKQQLKHKKAILQQCENRLRQQGHRQLANIQSRFDYINAAVSPKQLSHLISAKQQSLTGVSQRAMHSIQRLLQSYRQTLALNGAKLQMVSPLSTLDRGYSVVFDEQGKVIQNANDINLQDNIEIKLAKGKINATVTHIEN